MTTGIELLALGSKAAGKIAFAKGVEQTLCAVSTKTKARLVGRKSEQAIAKLFTQLSKVRLVKTLWQIDKPVDIGTFYCTSHVYIEGERREASTLEDLCDGNLLVQGIAGQGKSIFLRYICGVEMVRGQFIPIFLELRRVPHAGNLLNAILTTTSEFGLNITSQEFDELAASGRLLLLLDGFDEVDEVDKSSIITQIEHLAKSKDTLRIIVSSRPHSGLEVSPVFQLVSLSDLEDQEYKAVVYRLLEDSSTAQELIKQVDSHGGAVKELLKTPLLVTLLVVNYKSFQEVPAQLSDFYDSLFELLLQRHDGSKPGYRRKRLSSLNDTECRRVFEALCYLLKKHARVMLNHNIIYATASEALRVAGVQDDAEKYMTDIVKITCLIVKDGEEYRFIHKSVQEYYAACFIRNRPDVVAEKIYSRLFTGFRGGRLWDQEIRFLAEIDAYRFRKFGLIPGISAYLGIPVSELNSSTPQQVKPEVINRLRSATLHFFKFSHRPDVQLTPDGVGCDLVSTLDDYCLFPLFRLDCNRIKKCSALRNADGENVSITLGEALDEGILTAELDELALQVAASLLQVAKEAISKTAHAEEDPLASIPIE